MQIISFKRIQKVILNSAYGKRKNISELHYRYANKIRLINDPTKIMKEIQQTSLSIA